MARGRSTTILGIDLAWGERMPDGVCALRVSPSGAAIESIELVKGDTALLDWVAANTRDDPVFVAVDGPLVCKNLTGAREVDRETHVHFGRHFAGCHPTNLTKCPRPPRIADALVAQGYHLGWDLAAHHKMLAEVYPHPAMVRLFNIPFRIPYKKGRVVERRIEFRRLQHLMRKCFAEHFPRLNIDRATARLLREPWSKPIEDRTDALFCALIGYWHCLHRGRYTQVLGELEHGFVLVPQPPVSAAGRIRRQKPQPPPRNNAGSPL